MTLTRLVLSAALLAALLQFSACRIQSPEYRGIENLHLEALSKGGMELGAEAVFYNPNKLHCKLKDVHFDIYMNNDKMATIEEMKDVKIAKNSEFRIPLNIIVNPEGNFLATIKNIFGAIKDREVAVRFQGLIFLKAYLIPIKIPINDTKKVTILGKPKN
jgi:LEA14-like dessication related protein